MEEAGVGPNANGELEFRKKLPCLGWDPRHPVYERRQRAGLPCAERRATSRSVLTLREQLGLGVEEAAFYDALAGGVGDGKADPQLAAIANDLVMSIRADLVALDCAVDTATPAGEAMANVLATFAQFERRLIGQRTREALAAKPASGVRLGRPMSLPVPVRGRVAAERKAGRSLAAIAEILNAEQIPTAQGGRQWWPSTVRAVLRAA